MDDGKIVSLFWERNEEAIKKTEEKYSRYCTCVARGILSSDEDVEECINDMLLRAWNGIPPAKPDNLKAFLGKITRNLALDKHDLNSAEKRKSNTDLIYDELSECIPDPHTGSEETVDSIALKNAINKFLSSLSRDKRIIFMQRYWYLSSVKEIAQIHKMTESSVKITLMRLRAKFKKFLEKEGIRL